MARGGDKSREAAGGKRRRQQQWEVEFARYFATPRRGPSTPPPPPGLRYVSRGRNRLHGTWLPAASRAALRISRPTHSFAAHVLTVSIGNVVYEEHYVSILNFSWPQVACVPECPVRGSRVVFVSFCDRSKQIQKFAVRFPQLSDAESFLNSVKELSSNTMDIIPSGSDCVHEDSSSSEYISSSGLQYRPDEMASFEEPTSDHRTAAPSFDYHEELDQSVLPSPLATNIDSSYSDFPHNYFEMPAGCSIKYEKDGDEPYPATATGHAPERAYILDTCHDVAHKKSIADKGKGAAKEIDASIETFDMAGIETYVASDSFNGRRCYAVRGNACSRGDGGSWCVGRQPGDFLRSSSGERGCGGRARVIHPCGTASAGLPSEIVNACRISPPASRRWWAAASPVRRCILLRAGELSDENEYSPARRVLASPIRPSFLLRAGE